MGALDGLKAMAKMPAMASPAVEAGDDESEDPKMAAVTPAAEDLLAAIKTGDAQGVARALVSAHEACAGDYGAETTPESGEA